MDNFLQLLNPRRPAIFRLFPRIEENIPIRAFPCFGVFVFQNLFLSRRMVGKTGCLHGGNAAAVVRRRRVNANQIREPESILAHFCKAIPVLRNRADRALFAEFFQRELERRGHRVIGLIADAVRRGVFQQFPHNVYLSLCR